LEIGRFTVRHVVAYILVLFRRRAGGRVEVNHQWQNEHGPAVDQAIDLDQGAFRGSKKKEVQGHSPLKRRSARIGCISKLQRKDALIVATQIFALRLCDGQQYRRSIVGLSHCLDQGYGHPQDFFVTPTYNNDDDGFFAMITLYVLHRASTVHLVVCELSHLHC